MNIRVIAIIYLNSITTSLSRLLFINVKPVNETVPKKRRKKYDCYSGRKRERTSRLNKTFTDTKGAIFKARPNLLLIEG